MKSPELPKSSDLILSWDHAAKTTSRTPSPVSLAKACSLDEYLDLLEESSRDIDELRRCKVFPERFRLEITTKG